MSTVEALTDELSSVKLEERHTEDQPDPPASPEQDPPADCSGGRRKSSTVKEYRKLGDVGPHKEVTGRPLKPGDEGKMVADRIPPMASLKRAARLDLSTLQKSNKVLYDMVMSVKTGRNLLAMVVSTSHHKAALSTGNRKDSYVARGVVARSIASGDVMLMLKQAMIIAHPYCAQKMRENAGIEPRPETQIDETNAFYRTVFLKMIKYYCEKNLIDEMEKSDLEKYVDKDGYLMENSPEYQEILVAVRSVTKRPLKPEDKGDTEVDHIPPLDSLKRAENEAEFEELENRNIVLYDMVMSMTMDPTGRDLLAVVFSTPHHRGALSTGNRKDSDAARGVVARSIASGDVMLMLKQAMIIAHPICAQKMRENAGIVTRPETQIAYYRTVFLEMINHYCENGLITEIEKSELEEYVNEDGYLEENSPEYQEILKVVRSANL